MGKTHILAMGLILALFFAGPSSSQGMGNSKSYDQNSYYDWMGTPVVSGQTNAVVPDYLEAYGAQRPEWDPYGVGSDSSGLRLEPADPALEELSVEGGVELSNQLYMQAGPQLLAQGKVPLGVPYVLWARVIGKGSFLLYDYNRQVLNQGYVTPGWYKIKLRAATPP